MVGMKKVKCEPTDWQIVKGAGVIAMFPDSLLWNMTMDERRKLAIAIYKKMVGNPPKPKVKMTTNKKPKMYITTAYGMSGHFAVMIHWNMEDLTMVFCEPYDTGKGRYRTVEEAAAEGIEWAAAEGLKFVPKGSPIPKECTYHE